MNDNERAKRQWDTHVFVLVWSRCLFIRFKARFKLGIIVEWENEQKGQSSGGEKKQQHTNKNDTIAA